MCKIIKFQIFNNCFVERSLIGLIDFSLLFDLCCSHSYLPIDIKTKENDPWPTFHFIFTFTSFNYVCNFSNL